MKQTNRKVYLAVPNWETVHKMGGETFYVTVFQWDFGNWGLIHKDGEILIPAQRRGERQSLRYRLTHAYGFPYARTVVVC